MGRPDQRGRRASVPVDEGDLQAEDRLPEMNIICWSIVVIVGVVWLLGLVSCVVMPLVS
jgi:hypothetical protein